MNENNNTINKQIISGFYYTIKQMYTLRRP